DKCLLEIGGKPLLAHVVERMQPQVRALAINANGDPVRFAPFNLPVIADVVPGFAGPLAGILTGMVWAKKAVPDAKWLLSVAGDTPFLPRNLAGRLGEAAGKTNAAAAMAESGGRRHPVFGLWSLDLMEDLERAVVVEGVRKIVAWADRYPLARVDFSTRPLDPFFNINRPEDLKIANTLSTGQMPP
ncbi:MAG: molybdenum cofactor guanylyltransferase MobA, partial [Alphaproteobacteria bacterium]